MQNPTLTAPTPADADPLIRQMLADWHDTCQRPDIPRILRRWGRREPALAGLESLTAILEQLGVGGATYAERDAILFALLRIAQQRSGPRTSPTPDAAIAGRVVLQAMAPAAWKIARSHSQFLSAGYDDIQTRPDRLAATLAALWETILNYNLDRPAAARKVAASLKLDTLNRLTRGGIWRTHNLRATRETTLDYDDSRPTGVWSRLDHPAVDDLADYGPDAAPGPDEACVQSLLDWARRHHHLHDTDLHILALTYLDGLDQQTAAAHLGITHAAFRKRASRAVMRLREAYRGARAAELLT